jgi:hypothetical protein
MSDRVRRYLSEIGRRGGTRSRRTLTPEQARAMVVSREAKRAVREFEHSPLGAPGSELPGVEIVRTGLRDLARREPTIDALLVSIASPRLRQLGIRVPEVLPEPEDALFDRLEDMHGDGAHSRYNALIRRMVSFARAAAIGKRTHA